MLTTSDWSVIIMTIVGILLLIVFPFLSDNIIAGSYYALILQSETALLAGIFCLSTGIAYPSGNALKTVWVIFGIAALCWFTGNLIFSAYVYLNNGAEPPYPYFSDIGYLSWVLLAIIGFYLFKKTLPISVPLWGGAIAALVFFAAVAAFYMMGMFGGEGLVLVASSVYSVLPPLMSVAAIIVFSCLFGGVMSSTWFVMVLGVTAYFIAHFMYIYEASNGVYQSGHSLVDVILCTGFLLVTVAAMIGYNQLKGMAR